MKTISVFGSNVGREEKDEIASSLDSQWMGIGPKVGLFEAGFAARLGLTDFAMVDSGSNALYLALKILALPPGSEVILPSFTWIACAHAVILCQCTPVFCDVDLRTHNVTADTIAPHITSKTAAIMVVHYAGKPVRMGPILSFGYPVVEDAAHAVDSKLNGSYCGGIGDIGIYSFDAVKNLATPEGGGITARESGRVARARQLRYCGIQKSGFEASAKQTRWWEYSVTDVSPKFLPNDICASVALAQLKKLDTNQTRRRQVWDLYQREFSSLDWLVAPADPEKDEQHSYFTYCVRVPGVGDRDRLATYLLQRGIYTTLRYHPLHLNRIYGSSATLPVSEKLNEEALSLPIHPGLTDGDLDRILSAVRDFDGTGARQTPKPPDVRR